MSIANLVPLSLTVLIYKTSRIMYVPDFETDYGIGMWPFKEDSADQSVLISESNREKCEGDKHNY